MKITCVLLLLAWASSHYSAALVIKTTKEETGANAYLGNIQQEFSEELPPLSPQDKPRQYEILNGGDKIKINKSSGDIRTAERLNRETICPDNPPQCVIDVEIVVLPHVHFQLLKMQFILEDLNDNRPRFPQDIIRKEISESAVVGSIIRLDSAVDPDLGDHSIKRYRISSAPPGPRDVGGYKVPFFQLSIINNIDGTKIPQLNLTKKLDREKSSGYKLLLYCIDGGSPPLTGTATVEITVTDSNDNQPHFTQDTYVRKVPEDAKPGTRVIKVVATDLDSGSNADIVYSFPSAVSAQDRALFSLDNSTGEITIKAPGLDFENKTIHHLSVEAKDRGPNPASAYATVTVKVLDINDEAPNININFMDFVEKSSESNGPVIISENIEVGTYLAFVTITDRDTGKNGNVSCRINEPSSFELHELDKKENRYLIKTKSPLDREDQRFHNIVIEAWDFGTPSLSNKTIIRVELGDINDNDPKFDQAAYEATVPENSKINTFVTTLHADDPDAGKNSEVTYSSAPLFENTPFSIDPKSGKVTLTENVQLDAENITEPFMLTITATDNGQPPRSTSTVLSITVSDENDNSPTFTKDTYNFSVRENIKNGFYVGEVHASDSDIDKKTNAFMTYAFEGKTGERQPFDINPETGAITFIGNSEDVDREARQSQPYNLRVIASDHGEKPKYGYVNVQIYLTDINDNKPQIIYPNVSRDISVLYVRPKMPSAAALVAPNNPEDEPATEAGSIAEGSPLVGDLLIGDQTALSTHAPNHTPVIITQIQASDPDLNQNGRVRFMMDGGNKKDYFSVDMNSGDVLLNIEDGEALRKMKKGCHVVRIVASDLGEPPMTEFAYVNIFVTDQNPGQVNFTDAMKDCKNNSIYPISPTDKTEGVGEASVSQLTLILIIGIGAVLFILIIIVVVVLIKYKCRCGESKQARTYNCQKAAGNIYSDVSYGGSPMMKGKPHLPGGTVDSRSSYYSEQNWTESQLQLAQQEKNGGMVHSEHSDGSVGSHSARDSGTGDSMPSDAYHGTGAPGYNNRAPFHSQSFLQRGIHPGYNTQQPSHVHLPPTDDQDRRGMTNSLDRRKMGYTKCTPECSLYGHGDTCWMPDSLQRPPSRMTSFKGVDEFDGDGYQKRPMNYPSHEYDQNEYNDMRYAGMPATATPYYYDPGSKFEQQQQQARGKFSTFRDDAVGSDTGSPTHSQVTSSNVSRQPSVSNGYRSNAPYHVQAPLSRASYAQSPIPFNSQPGIPAGYGAQQPRGKAYVHLQGYEGGNPAEEAHSNLSSASSGNHHQNYPPHSYGQQPFYGHEQPHQNYPYQSSFQQPYQAQSQQAMYDEQAYPQYADGNDYGVEPAAYQDDFAATNLLLSPVDSEPGDYKLRLERQMQQLSPAPPQNFASQEDSEEQRLINKADASGKAMEEGSTDKLSTIREELDADEVMAGIEGLLL